MSVFSTDEKVYLPLRLKSTRRYGSPLEEIRLMLLETSTNYASLGKTMKLLKNSALLLFILLLTYPAPVCIAKDQSSSLDLARELNQAFVEVAEKVSPMVVVITVVQKPSPAFSDDQENDPYEGLPREFRRYFRRQFEEAPPEKSQGEGSGIIIRPNGYILTNRHVVEDAESIEARLQDGRAFKATLRGADPQSDLAVIKIDAAGLPVATLADSSKTRVGEFAIAIGAPYSFDYTVTYGHVSAKSRSNVIPAFDGGAIMDQDFIQTDANINPGNSGGPLVNINGEVIGVNTLIHGLHTGIGFAIPSNLVREVADQIIASGKFTRAWLGVEIRALRDEPDFRALVKTPDAGVVVRSIVPNGPAAKSDLKPSDIITAIEGHSVSTPQQVRSEIRSRKIGQPVTLDVIRSGKNIQVKVTPAEFIEPATIIASSRTPAQEPETNALGITPHVLTRELADQFGAEVTDGVLVMAVDNGSLAAQKGIKPGDIITSINQQAVANPKQFREALKKADLKKGVIITLVSKNTARFEILKEE